MSVYFKSACESFLSAARHGSVDEAKAALQEVPPNKWAHVINIPGDSKSNKSWSALQLASYFGHDEMVKFLLDEGAEVDYQNDCGNTALHLAAFTKRCEIVLSIINSGAHVFLVNGEGKTPKSMAEENEEIFKILEQTEKIFMMEQEEKLFKAARANDADQIIDILNSEYPPSINCRDASGNTPLHVAANRNKHEVAVILLQNGANPSLMNNASRRPVDLTTKQSMQRVLGMMPVNNAPKEVQRFEGEIMKRNMFLMRRYWVVMSRGLISFYGSRSDSINRVRRKGFLFLREASVKASSLQPHQLIIKSHSGHEQQWSISSGLDRNGDRTLRQKWVTALQLHIDYANKAYPEVENVANPSQIRSKSRPSWDTNCSEPNLRPISSVRDTLLNAQGLVKLLESQVSEMASTIGGLGSYSASLDPTSRRMMEPESASMGAGGATSSGMAGTSLTESRLCSNHFKVLRQMIDVSELSRNVTTSLEQCMLVMSQQEEYRLEQLNEVHRKNEILENALRILAHQHHNLELTLNESYKSATAADSSFINQLQKTVEKHMDSHSNGAGPHHGTMGAQGGAVMGDEFGDCASDDEPFFDAGESFADDLSLDARASSPIEHLIPGTECNGVRAASDVSNSFEGDEMTGISMSSSESVNSRSPSKQGDTVALVLNDKCQSASQKPTFLENTTLAEMFSSCLGHSEDERKMFVNCFLSAYRQQLPAEMPKSKMLSIWETLKELLGKDLTRVSMPVYFNEPLSMLQRSCEFMESVFLLAKASKLKESLSQMVLVATFATVCINSLSDRLNKPFNPILGETFQFTDEEVGVRVIAEQVSHHPPITAFNFQSSFAHINGNAAPKISFGGMGQSIQVRVIGSTVVDLKLPSGKVETISWSNPRYVVHNIIAGQLWLEQVGVLRVVNHSSKFSAEVEFKQAGFFRGSLHEIEGYVKDPSGINRMYLFGKWNEQVHAIPVESLTKHMEERRPGEALSEALRNDPECVLVWKRNEKLPNSQLYYNFSAIAMAMNDKNLKHGSVEDLPKSDSRLRPDIRFLEEGQLNKATEEKYRLEQKQRAARASRDKSEAQWKPLWFDEIEFEDGNGLTNQNKATINSSMTSSLFNANIPEVPVQKYVQAFKYKCWNMICNFQPKGENLKGLHRIV